ncbi:hypothetical protein E3G68_005061 [Mycobacteroides abscessus]|uniref:NlpC/P60 family protein n=1 Tax=Mycobacteroides abscessus TaxID=36809 RepID=UPI001877A657|nr:hypothetical protein [Mycobacteroides abscessus]
MTQPSAPIATADDPATSETENPSTATPARPAQTTGQSEGPVPVKPPPLPGTSAPGATPPPPGTATPAAPGTTPPNGQNPNGTGTVPATTTAVPGDTKLKDGKEDSETGHKGDHNNADSDSDRDASADTPPDPGQQPSDVLGSLANLGPQLASPLINAATGIPAAALQGAGGLIPGLASAVMPQLAALANQLGTGAPPGRPSGRLNTNGADSLAGSLGSLVGEGPAADAARSRNEALARQVGAMRDVERQLGEILGLSSARTEGDRAKIQGVIDDVETALMSAGVQGDTPEAQTAVMTAMRKALDEAGNVVSSAARDKLTDAEFVRSLIQKYLAAAGSTDSLHAGVAGSDAGANAARIAHDALGLPYVWGGGGALGPTGGGFDCSGLTQWAVARASGGRVILPRTTYEQIHAGTAVPLNALAPGDLVFSNWSSPGVPEHVAIYIGNGQVIEAPQRGVPVHISNLPSGAQARRVL